MLAFLFDGGEIERLFWARAATPAVVIGAFVGVVVLTAFLYGRRQGLPTWVRVVLAALRLSALGLLVAVLFEPTATIAREHSQKRRFAVLMPLALLGAIPAAQSQARAKSLRVLEHAQSLVELCEQAQEEGQPGHFDAARSELSGLEKDLERLEGLVGQVEAGVGAAP